MNLKLFDFGENRKSPPLARILSFILPGLGHIYSNNILSGIIWIVLICLYWAIVLYIFVILLERTFDIREIGFLVVYFGLGQISGNQAADLTVQYNGRQSLKEQIKKNHSL